MEIEKWVVFPESRYVNSNIENEVTSQAMTMKIDNIGTIFYIHAFILKWT